MLVPKYLLVLAALIRAGTVAQEQGARLEPPVDYLARAPVIDGKPDEGLERLPVRQFVSFTFSDRETIPSHCTYRLGYTAAGLYLYIETGKAELAGRDRAYQNGDGFHVMPGIPAPGDSEGTKEFHVPAFSPLDTTRRGKFIWYRNVDLAFTPLRLTQVAAQPDFQDTALLRSFRDIPIFIYHGGRDRNCPVEQTEEPVRKLRAAGAAVEFPPEPGKGHESPGPNTAQAYRRWLKGIADR